MLAKTDLLEDRGRLDYWLIRYSQQQTSSLAPSRAFQAQEGNGSAAMPPLLHEVYPEREDFSFFFLKEEITEDSYTLEEALNLKPDDARALRLYARLSFERSSFEEARDSLVRASKSGPEDPEADMLLSRTYFQLGNRELSEEMYRKAVRGNPDLEDASYLDMIHFYKGEKMPATGKTAAQLMDRETPFESELSNITFRDVGGMDEVKEYLSMNIILPLKKPEMFRAYGKRVGGGILMYGPPGCGKTYIARALAGECNARFYSAGIHDILDMWLGKSERNMHALFQQARENAPSIVFLDEIDALGQKRNPGLATLRGVTDTLLAEMDNVGTSDKPILIIGATNTPWSIDTAFRRPGRFDRVVFVPPPDQKAREDILKLHLRGKPIENIDIEKIASRLERFSGADIRAVVDRSVEKAIKLAIRSGKTELVTGRMLLDAAKEMRPSTDEWLATAYDYVRFSNESGIYDQVKAYLDKDD
jgi:transitional endoplasmic reticulum ATPase